MDDSRNSLAAGAGGEVAVIGAQRPAPHLTHRPRRASRPAPRLLAALLAGLAALVLAAPAQAQTVYTYVTNSGQPQNSANPAPVGGATVAQGFTTGSTTGGYNISSVNIGFFVFSGVTSFTLSLYDDSSGSPGTSEFTFTNPSSLDSLTASTILSGTTQTFTAPADTTLSAGTYYIVATSVATGAANLRFDVAFTNNEDSGAYDGWSIANSGLVLSGSTWGNTSPANALRIAVKGTAAASTANAVPTASNGTVTTNEDTDYTFVAANFNFADTDTGDTLSSVKIVTLPATGKGTLKLSGTAVTANAAVTKAQLDAGNLKYTPPANANGTGYASFTFRVNDGTGDSTSAYTMTIDVTAVNDPATGTPTITGTAQVDQTLTAVTTGIMDADGLTSPSYTYQWIRVNGSDADISGATSSTYTLLAADEGKTIKVKVSFTDDASNPETRTSAATAAVTAAANNPATGAPTITGTAQVDQTLTAVTTGIMDADGLTNVRYTYQWIRVNGSDADISGATSSTYTLLAADQGKTIKVKVSFTDDASHSETRTSAATASVTAADNNPATGAPTITGTAQVGQTLTAVTTGIMDADGLTSVSYTYQWIRVNGSDADISGATASTYTLLAADQGKTIKVKVSFTDDASHSETRTSAATAAVTAAANNPATGAPTITGTAQVGQTLTAVTTGIMDADGLTSVSYTYQWIRVDGGTETNISLATSSTYTLLAADQGKTIKVKVSFTDDASHSETRTSAATAAVTAAANNPATGAPTITGTAQVGQTLTAVTTGIMDADGLTSVSYTYQWIRVDGGTETNISLATSSTYTLLAADQGKTIKVKVSFTDDASNPETRTSAATAAVTAAANTDTTAPTVTITGVPATSSAPFTAAFTFSEAVTGFVVGDITLGNATATNFTDTSASVYTVLITPTAEGTVTVDVAAGVAQDAARNGNTAASRASSSYTASPSPVISIVAGTSPVTEGTAATFTLTRTGNATAMAAAVTVDVSVFESEAMISGTAPTSVMLAANARTATLRVPTERDDVDEADSEVTVRLNNPDANADVFYLVDYQSEASVTVRDDDLPTIKIEAGGSPVTKGYQASFLLYREGYVHEPDPLTVQVRITETGDMLATPRITEVEFTTGLHLAYLDQDTVSNDTDDADSVVTATVVASPATYTVGMPKSATVTVSDDTGGGRDETPPMLTGATVSGSTLVLTYNKTLDGASVPVPGDFAVTAAGSPITVTGVRVAGSTVTLTLATAVEGNQAVTLAYTPRANPIQDAADNGAAALSGRTVTNNTGGTTDETPPMLTGATVNGSTLVLTYDEALDGASVPAEGDFVVTADGSAITVNGVRVAGSTVTLTLATAVESGQTVTLAYTPGANPIQDAAGNDAALLSGQTVANNTGRADVTPPALTGATVNGSTLVLTYGETLHGASVPATGDFAVTAAGSAITVNGVRVAGSTVTLTLATAVEAGQTVTLAYTPGTNPIQDAAGNDAAALSGQTVANNTGSGGGGGGGGGSGGGGGGGGGGGTSQTVPDAPTNLVAEATDGAVTLRWDAPEEDGGTPITDYEYRINGAGDWISTVSTETTYTVTGLDNDTEYTFEVRAVNRIGRSQAPPEPAEVTPRAAVALDFAHFANGDGTTSEVVLVNVAPYPIRPAIYFYDQEGEPMAVRSVVDLTPDLEILEDGALSVRTAMEPLGELTLSTHGRENLRSGSLTVVAAGPIGGVLRYSVPEIGVAGVGASPPLSDAIFPARRQADGINTGVAIRNQGEAALVVQCQLMQDGAVLEAMDIPLKANGQDARFIDQVFPATDTSDFAGSVRCTAPGRGRFSAIAVEMDAAGGIFTTLPVVEVSRGRAEATTLDFAHFANGTWITDLVFVNLETRPSGPPLTPFHTAILPSRPVIYFYDTEGNPIAPELLVDITGDMEVTEDGGLTVQTEMEPLGVLTISTHGRGELVSGSVRVVSEGPIGGMLRFDHPDLGVAGLGASRPVSDAIVPVRRQEGGITTGVAIHNLESTPELVRCELRQAGVLLDAVSIPLQSNGQTAWLIDQTFPGTDTSGFVGSVRCAAPGEGLFTAVALELDVGNRIFTTLPVVPVLP